MKSVLAAIAVFASFSAFAGEINEGSFTTYPVAYDVNGEKPNGNCNAFTKADLVSSKLSGNILLLENGLSGICEIFVIPNPRFVKLDGGKDDGCGSSVYEGGLYNEEGYSKVTVTDNRGRYCDDIVAAKLVIEFENSEGNANWLYSYK